MCHHKNTVKLFTVVHGERKQKPFSLDIVLVSSGIELFFVTVADMKCREE